MSEADHEETLKLFQKFLDMACAGAWDIRVERAARAHLESHGHYSEPEPDEAA